MSVENEETQYQGTPSKEDRKAISHYVAKKGFSKYVSPRTEMIIGIVVFIMICSPAIFFTISLSVPYYTLAATNCNTTFVGTSDWGLDPNPIPPHVFYGPQVSPDIGLLNFKGQLDWLLMAPWSLYLSKGVCPNGKSSEWPKYCIPYNDPPRPSLGYPGVWTAIDLENQQQFNAGWTTTPVYSDMLGAAKNFRQAFGFSVLGCIVSWIFILYTVYTAIRTEIDDGHAGLDLKKEKVPGDFGDLRLTFTVDKSQMSTEEVARALVEEHIDHPSIEGINVHVLHRMVAAEEQKNTVTYTSAIAIELVVYLTLFGIAVSIIRLLEQSDMVDVPQAWKGFFATCDIDIISGTGPGILFYQCVSMGLYVFALMLCELYYVTEYLAQCMHNLFTHPDERAVIELHAENTGAKKPVPWTGPVFLSRIHLTKVRAIQGAYEAVFGARHVLTKDSHKDAWVPPPASMKERTMHDVRLEQEQRKAAKAQQAAPQPQAAGAPPAAGAPKAAAAGGGPKSKPTSAPRPTTKNPVANADFQL